MRLVPRFLAPCLTLCLALAPSPGSLRAADPLQVLPAEIDGAPRGAMMHGWLQRHVREAVTRRAAARQALRTPAAIGDEQARLRQLFLERLGPLPERTPLRARVCGTLQRDRYRLEKILFESQPGHAVTATLYLPDREGPHPGVLVPCGHSHDGKVEEAYQRACILLARNGCVALCYDPIGQGERYQVLSTDGEPQLGPTQEHFAVGLGSILVGRNAATYRIWDGMRALDYLASRPEVDPQRLGCTGNSGGGTLTSYLMALDDRIVAAAPSCYLTSFARLLETIGPQDAEQLIFGQLAGGLEHAEYILLRAPRPTLICAATDDFFAIDGTWQTFRAAKRVYGHLGFPERVALVEADAKHGFSRPLREGAVRWMRRWLLARDDAITEAESRVATADELQCTEKGQVLLAPGGRSVFDLNRALAEQFAAGRATLWDDLPRARDEVRRLAGVRTLEQLPRPEVVSHGRESRDGYTLEKIELRPEPGIHLPALLLTPGQPSGEAWLLVDDRGKASELAELESLAADGHLVLAVDLRGVGETRPAPRGHLMQVAGEGWQDAAVAYLLGRSFVGMRTEDLLVAARWFRTEKGAGRPLHLAARGRLATVALHAAALEPKLLAEVRLEGGVASWAEACGEYRIDIGLADVVHGALRAYDLTDLATSLPPGMLKRRTNEKTGDAP